MTSLKKIAVLIVSCMVLGCEDPEITDNGIEQSKWKEITSIEEVCEAYPETMQTMLDQFNLDYPGLEKVKAAYGNDELVNACQSLLDYYKNSNSMSELRKEIPAKSDRTVAEADSILNDIFVINYVGGKVPYLENGHRDWYYLGPNNDREWAWVLNRHHQLLTVFETYFETGNPKYAEYIDLFLRDYIIASMPYPAVKSSESVWRGLEVAARAKAWTRVFYGLIQSENFSPATQLLLLSSLLDHAHYNRNFHWENNWLVLELSGLVTVGAYFPEYQKSDEWLTYAVETMAASMEEQVYPDGVQFELASSYHIGVLRNFELFQDIYNKADKPLPDVFNQTTEAMYSYIAHSVRPDGFGALNNDSYRQSNRELILSGAEKFNKPEWEYIVTNGHSGVKPAEGPSYFYPWAGQLISRSGFDANAHWSFFDIGPLGKIHQHNDKLHISIAAYGRDLLVDAGRFAYQGDIANKFRPYAVSSTAHNVILIDDRGQDDGPRVVDEPLGNNYFKITEDFDYASNAYDRFAGILGEAKHNRSVFYVRGEFWIVADRIITDRARKIDVLWHWHPNNEVVQDNMVVKTNNQHGNLAVIPIQRSFNVELVEGQETPEIQGWYSPETNLYEPNTTSIYSANISSTSTLVWLLLPSENEMPKVQAEIISETDDEVKVEVQSNGKDWELTIPFMNSEGAALMGQ